jgi:hypothetical protein
MKCEFCGREVENTVLECPYCHYQFKRVAQVLNPNERDSFEGVTIEEDGSTNDGGSKTQYQYQTKEEYTRYDQANQGQQHTTIKPQFKVHTMGCGSGILMTLLILGGILALFFFLLPTFIVFAAIGAVVVFILRLFM